MSLCSLQSMTAVNVPEKGAMIYFNANFKVVPTLSYPLEESQLYKLSISYIYIVEIKIWEKLPDKNYTDGKYMQSILSIYSLTLHCFLLFLEQRPTFNEYVYAHTQSQNVNNHNIVIPHPGHPHLLIHL